MVDRSFLLKGRYSTLVGILGIALIAMIPKLEIVSRVVAFSDEIHRMCLWVQYFQGKSVVFLSEAPPLGTSFRWFLPGWPLVLAGVDSLLGHSVALPTLMMWLSALGVSFGIGLCLPLFHAWGLEGRPLALSLLGLVLATSVTLYGSLPGGEGVCFPWLVGALWAWSARREPLALALCGVAALFRPEAFLLIAWGVVQKRSWVALASLAFGLFPFLGSWSAFDWLGERPSIASDWGLAIQSGILGVLVFFNPIIVGISVLSLSKLRLWPPAALLLGGTFAISIVFPGGYEGEALSCSIPIFYLFGESCKALPFKGERLVFCIVLAFLLGCFFKHFPDRYLAELTRSVTFQASSRWIGRQSGDFGVLGAEASTLAFQTGKRAFATGASIKGKADFEVVEELVRNHGLRFQLITNYHPQDQIFERFCNASTGMFVLPDGWRLSYRSINLNLAGYFSASPVWGGLWFRQEVLPRWSAVYRLALLPPEP